MAKRQQLLTFTCAWHGPFPAWTVRGEIPPCWCGCSPCFVEPWEGDLPASALAYLWPPPPPPPPVPRAAEPDESDEQMSADEVRAALRRLLAEAPPGGKTPIARALGFGGRWPRHDMRSVARGRAYLFEAVRRRLSRRVQQLDRGELVLIPTGDTGAGKRLFVVTHAAPR